MAEASSTSRARAYVRNKISSETEKLSQRLDRLKTSCQGYNKIRSKILSRGASTMLDEKDFDDENTPQFRFGGKSQRKFSLDTDSVSGSEEPEFNSLPPIKLPFDDPAPPRPRPTTLLLPSSEPPLRRHSMAVTPVQIKAQRPWHHRFSLTTEEEPLLSLDRPVMIVTSRSGSRKRRRRSSRKKTKIVSENGAIMPSVLLTYQGGLFLSECDLYFQSNSYNYEESV